MPTPVDPPAPQPRSEAEARGDLARLGPLAVLTALCALIAAHGLSYWVIVDDAFIAFRYAENLADGLGLVFNEGERVEGYTDFLWVMILAGARWLGADVPSWAQWLGLTFGIALLPVLYVAGRRCYGLSPWTALLPCAVVACSASTAMWIGGGLEVPLYTALFTLALTVALRDLARGPRWPLSGVAFGLAALCRPEAAGLFAALLVFAFVRRMTTLRVLALMLLGFVVVFGPHLVFRLAYYGYPLPNTFYAKTGLKLAAVVEGLGYIGDFLRTVGVWALLPLAGLLVEADARAARSWQVPLVLLAVIAVYLTLVGGDFYPHSRFLVPYLPFLALLVCSGAVKIGRLLQNSRRGRWQSRHLPAAVAAGVALSMALPAKLWADALYDHVLPTMRDAQGLFRDYGVWLREHKPASTLLATHSLGRIPYYSGLRTIDMLGLADLHIAHQAAGIDRASPGHEKFDSAYVLSRRPDVIAFEFGTSRHEGPAPDHAWIYRRVRRLAEGTDRGGLPLGFWRSAEDMLRRQAFRRAYAPRAIRMPSGFRFLIFERK